ncbi:Hsp20/alpha crystallin family protein [Streptomonospora sp. PA3]|uniref:Hsp20/alpha crystallin family protein n=1 Tax=Streptomonospora sp. PA3 TaxID=2607326 RepID=UPI0012DFBF50|nr:Hsp20/alpha crystallin family protein [Streptomonospora sp. PA3]MUL41565.1 Hsp20/alpha crystallin family protein [Streptomonospora sp. PA3]
MMLMRTDPFRDVDRLTRSLLGDSARQTPMPMDAYRQDGEFVVSFDLPGVRADSIDLEVERDVLTVKAERPGLSAEQEREAVIAERPRGTVLRRLLLGEMLDADNLSAEYAEGVLTLRIPVAQQAKPRKIAVSDSGGGARRLGS